MGLTVSFEVLNQLGTPLMYSETLANRPAFGIAGRIFFRTDSPFGIYRDTGSAWDLISSAGGADTNIYNTDGTLTANRTVSSGGFSLTINPSTTFATTLTAAIGSGAVSAFGVNTLSYAAAFSSSSLGSVYGAIGGFNLQTFAGSATFANANIAAANSSINSVDFSSASSTITMTQASGLRAMAGHINMFQYQGTNSGTITHAAVIQNLGFYRPPAASGILTITNAYGFLLNDLNDYGAGFIFTNRWGIYQAGASEKNFFAGNTLVGSTTDAGEKLQVTGTGRISSTFLTQGLLTSTANAYIESNSINGTPYIGIKSTDVIGFNQDWRIQKAARGALGLGHYLSIYDVNQNVEKVNVFTGATGGVGIFTTTNNGYALEVNGSVNTGTLSASNTTLNGGASTILSFPNFSFTTFSTSFRLTASVMMGVINTTDNSLILSNTDLGGTSAVASALLELKSTTRGFLPPRMTTTQKNAIATPNAGLIIYDSTLNKLCVYTTAWETITSI